MRKHQMNPNGDTPVPTSQLPRAPGTRKGGEPAQPTGAQETGDLDVTGVLRGPGAERMVGQLRRSEQS